MEISNRISGQHFPDDHCNFKRVQQMSITHVTNSEVHPCIIVIDFDWCAPNSDIG